MAYRPPHLDLSYKSIGDAGFHEVGRFIVEREFIETIDLRGNELTGQSIGFLSYALYTNKHIRRLDLSFNHLGRNQGFDIFCRTLETMNELQELNMRACELTSTHAADISKLLRRNNALRAVDLSWNVFGNYGGQLIYEGIKDNVMRNMSECQLSGCDIREDLLIDIAHLLMRNRGISGGRPWTVQSSMSPAAIPSLMSPRLGSPRTPAAPLALADDSYRRPRSTSPVRPAFSPLRTPSPGRRWDMSGSPSILDTPKYRPALFDEEPSSRLATELEDFLQVNKYSNTLDLSYRKIGNYGAYKVARFITEHPFADEVLLPGNNITGEGARFLADALTSPAVLVRKLDLGDNQIAELFGLDTLCRALRVNRTVTHLSLANNCLHPRHGHDVRNMLVANRRLTHLDLSFNMLGASGGQQILDALFDNTTLVDCQMSGCRVPSDVLLGIAKRLERNRRGTY